MMSMKKLDIVAMALAAVVLHTPTGRAQAVVPLEHAHAHNDYEHARPLMEALEHGFTSIEADIYLVDGQLLVAHDRDKVDRARTLESLYLDPLRAIIRQRGGSMYATPYPVTLLIDIKSDSQSTYVALDTVLRRYADILTIFADTLVIKGPVVAVMSGERALSTVRKARVRFAGLDGRLADLDSSRKFPARVMPLISDNWDKVTKWKGEGAPPPTLRADIERIVARAHRHGQRVRFWATPDTEAVWAVLRAAGVDLIGADDLDGLRSSMLHHGASPAPERFE
jgi:glycerophosphoryl diester phosphodiesterase